jgi:NitT/TauT family transport system substrate-binding protein
MGPEPWAARLIHEAGGKILVDERNEWPNGQFASALNSSRENASSMTASGSALPTVDPVRSSVQTSARRAADLGPLGGKSPDLSGLFDLTLLNQVLKEKQLKVVR